MDAIYPVASIVAHMGKATGEERNMKAHEFTLLLTSDPNDDEADKMYGTFDDGTISTIAGVPQIRFHREAGSLEEAIRSAIGDVRSVGFDVARVEMEPNSLVEPSV